VTAESPSAPGGPTAAAVRGRGAATAAPARSFALALSLARTRAAVGARTAAATATAGLAAATSPAMALALRRGAADVGARTLRDRRDEAEEGRPTATGRAAPDAPRPVAGAAPDPLLAAAALDRVTIEARRLGDRPSVELRLGHEVAVQLTRAARGVEVIVHVAAARRRDAEAELPALVAALRARGVSLASAEVRTLAAPSAGRGPALTPRAPSDTRAHPRQ
jgi:hypothetical protein